MAVTASMLSRIGRDIGKPTSSVISKTARSSLVEFYSEDKTESETIRVLSSGKYIRIESVMTTARNTMDSAERIGYKKRVHHLL